MKITVFFLMILAFIFGYMDLLIHKNFERLHIFLFNLTVGGSTILFLTEAQSRPSLKVRIFFSLTIFYAVFAFLEFYLPSLVISLVLFLIVESTRVEKFGLFPADFFTTKSNVANKFHQASMFCLSLALLISSLVILNNEYYHWVYFPKLKLNVFFLGFSFPVSLITLSVIFSFMQMKTRFEKILEQVAFWNINLGVIIFFIFIIFENRIPEIIVSFTLFITVIAVFFLFIKRGAQVQEKHFLISGMFFLLGTGFTGIIYILLTKFGAYENSGKLILKMHSYLSLYGWNLTGLMIILRRNDFPLKLNAWGSIIFHWAVMLVLAPLGKTSLLFAILATISYFVFLRFYFAGESRE